MADAFIGEIRILPYTFPPVDWARCDGQHIQIGENPSLFSIISTFYGGNGRTDFALPNLQGRIPIGTGTGIGLTYRRLAEIGGMESVALTKAQIPAHNHQITKVHTDTPTSSNPTNMYMGKMNGREYYKTASDVSNFVSMSSSAISVAGQSVGHENRQPFLAMQYCISLEGIYPARN